MKPPQAVTRFDGEDEKLEEDTHAVLVSDDQVDISSDELEEVQTTVENGAKDVEMQDQELKMLKKRNGVEQAQDANAVVE